jgi:hypothetical protein
MLELAETNRPFTVSYCPQCGYYEEHRQQKTLIGFARGKDDKLNPAMFRRVAELMDEELSKAQEAGKVAPSPNTDEAVSHSDSLPAASNAFLGILEKAIRRCNEPDVAKVLEKMFSGIQWEEVAALGLVDEWAESITEKYQQEASTTDEDARYLRWKYGPPDDEDHGVEVVALNSKPTVHVVTVRRRQDFGFIETKEDGTYTAIAMLSYPPESEAELRRDGLTRQDAIDFIVGVVEHPLTADEDATFLLVLDYLADEPKYWSEELKVMARIYNRLNPTKPCKYADRSELASEPLDNSDDDFARGLAEL